MPLPSPPHFILLFLLGGAFLHFMLAGARTFHSENLQSEPGAAIGQFAFVACGTIPTWFLGLYLPIHRTNGILAALALTLSLGLYEWARHTIWGRRFGLGWGEHVPDALCDSGPYRMIRHPIYLSYILAAGAVLIALPHWGSALMFAMHLALFTHAAITDERKLECSALAADYSRYRERAGLFWPRLTRRASAADTSRPPRETRR